MSEKTLDTYANERDERRRAYLEARPLRDEFPRVRQLTLQLTFTDARGFASYSRQMRIFAPAATAFFKIPCPSLECMGGGFDLGSVIWNLSNRRASETSGRCDCLGRDSTDESDPHYCGVQLDYRVTVAYLGASEPA
jgi:hypothetical protein